MCKKCLLIFVLLGVSSCGEKSKPRTWAGGRLVEAKVDFMAPDGSGVFMITDKEENVLIPGQIVWVKESRLFVYGEKKAMPKPVKWFTGRWDYEGFFKIRKSDLKVSWHLQLDEKD